MDFRQERQMKTSIAAESAVRIAPGNVARIEEASGAWIHVWDGALWITQEGDPRDYCVNPGDSFEIKRDGLVLVSALRRAVVTLTAPVPALS
jgi:hypothetical protein